MRTIVVVGAGGFGREVLDVIDAVNAQASDPRWRVGGVVDDGISDSNLRLLEVRDVQHLGGTEAYLARAEPANYVIGIGSPTTRRAVADKFDHAGHQAATLVHPSATRGFGVRGSDEGR